MDTLAELIQTTGRPGAAQAIALIEQVAAALDAIHTQGLVHGNISLHTIAIAASGPSGISEVTLRGFGAAPDLARAASALAPEQAQGQPPDSRSDVYALTAVLYEMLSGRPPFEAETSSLVLMRKLSELAPPLAAEQLGLPRALDTVLAQGLDLDPARRFATAGQLALAARHALASATPPALVGTPSPVIVAGVPLAQPATQSSAPAVAPPIVVVSPPAYTYAGATAGSARTRRVRPYLLIGLLVAVLALVGGGALALRARGAGSPPAIAAQPTAAATQATASSQPLLTAAPQASQPPKQLAATATPRARPTEAPTALLTSTSTPARTPTPTAEQQRAPAALPSGRISISASAAAPPSVSRCGDQTTFGADNAIDGLPETTWRVPGDGRGAFLLLAFDTPVRVSALQLIPGYAKIDSCDRTNRFLQNRRVQRVELSFSDGSTVSGDLRDAPELQSITFPPVVTASVRVTIIATTAPGSHDGRDFTPISEIVVIGSEP